MKFITNENKPEKLVVVELKELIRGGRSCIDINVSDGEFGQTIGFLQDGELTFMDLNADAAKKLQLNLADNHIKFNY